MHIVKGVCGCIVKLYQSYTRDRWYIYNTTGATVDEVSKVLKEAGAEKVDVVTFAAGGNVVGKHNIWVSFV